MNQPHRWRFGAVAAAVALVASVVTLPAYALSLGRISVLSALGEPLRAEIDVAQITPEEASSLRAGVATPEAFKAAGLEYTPVLAGLEVTLQRRADGRSYLRLTSSRPVSEPFVDLVLQATWAAGRLTRDYTMLFDPPATRPSATAVAPTAPVLSRPTTPSPARTAAPTTAGEPSPVARPEPRVRPPAPRVASAENTGATDKRLTVRPGDTAGRIAAQNQPGAVSLDQMLVAMLRGNPNAFIGGNINRLKAGAVLEIPGADAAGAIPSSEASQTIIAQSKDFNNFRRKLAESVATTTLDPADRQAAGKVQAKVEDRAPANATPDKLTLSKGSVQAKSAAAAAEDAIAKTRQASEASARVAELSKNISDLNKLGVSPGAAAAPAATASAAKVPGLAVPTPSVVTTPSAPPASSPTAAASAPPTASAATAAPAAITTAPAAAQPASAAASAAAEAAMAMPSVTPASQPADSAATKPPVVVANKAVVPAVLPPETSLLDDLLENPLVLPLAAGLLALLAGLGIYSYRKRKGSAPVDSSFLESRLQPDSFFGASGGQRIDTNEVSASGSSLVYSPSQLDAAGDVDPVAEADVYLAYGRDLQAEEILKEALRTTPTRVAIHAKLAEIYAKRRDNKAFEIIALQAFNLTQGNGPEWAYVTEMGRELDALNPLYQPGGLPANDSKATPATSAPAAGTHSVGASAASMTTAGGTAGAAFPAFSSAPASTPAVDVDLDLDFPLGGMQDGHTSPAPIAALSPPEPVRAPVFDNLDMDFSDISSKPIALTYPVPISRAPAAGFQSNGAHAAPAKAAPAAPAAALPDSGMLEFDLDSLSLDLNGPSTQSPGNSVQPEDDPLQTKFLLAEEFRSLGDADGARSLAEEVLTEARGPLKVKAQAFLNSLV